MAVALQDWESPNSVDEEQMIAWLRDVGSRPPALTTAEIARLLDRTGSHRLRNAAALALADLKADGAAERIGVLLRRADVAPQSGSLLFALDELGGTLSLEGLLNILRNGSFEARSEALHFLDADRVSMADPESRRVASAHLTALAAGPDPDAAAAAQDALAMLPDRTGHVGSGQHQA